MALGAARTGMSVAATSIRWGSARLLPDEREAVERLLRVHGPRGLKAALLTHLLLPGHEGRNSVWTDENADEPQAGVVRADIERLGGASRLPWFECVLQRLASQGLADRQALLRSARRLLTAPGGGHALDRLHWLAMRRAFGEANPVAARSATAVIEADGSGIPAAALRSLAHYTGHLARLVPTDDVQGDAGLRWYLAAMLQWQDAASLPPCPRPDADALVQALATLQALPFNLRPRLVRVWFAHALVSSRGGVLAPCAADALRLSCGLLDSPVPAELGRHYIAIIQEDR
jgi:hypothetical protein